MIEEWKWVSELLIVVYGLSVIGYFIDFIQSNQKAYTYAFWLLRIAWFIQSIYFGQHLLVEQSFPVATLVDSLFFFSWILITLSLIIHKFIAMHFIVFFINLFGFFVLLLYVAATLKQGTSERSVEFIHEMLIAHISLAFVSYGFFTVSFFFSFLYLLQYHLLKKKKGLKWLWRIGNLHQLDQYSFQAITLGVPLLLISIILGLFWASISAVSVYWYDIKILGSIFVLVIYIIYLTIRALRRHRGKTLATYNTAAFLLLMINFLLSNTYSEFHF
ncbi:cytochrome c biogenesis protein [Oceanobacillus luteolus]|uniref:Cytochrome c biogenesis protein CcsA n=1 Tax=Oceanobacillus luteolus TaxID=1274358 RepID=A0ABW4HS05_9BACI|nr:cytochrome c biogenesis protein CcsA [Oceanobacillus luteolus]MCM3739938.1 cytochrome c biogenesis protein [Oceanobacillus luteolus]